MNQTLNVLVVDDVEKKREIVIQKISLYLLDAKINFDVAKDYESARNKLENNAYDLVILDIKIPAGGQAPEARWSRILLDNIVSGELGYPMHVFGLTEHEELAVKERSYFEKNTFGLHVFDWQDDDWARAICSKIEYISRAFKNGASYRLNSYDYDVVILTARGENEFIPIQEVIFGGSPSLEHPLWPQGAHFGNIVLRDGVKLKAALICIGKAGLSPAATVTTQAIQTLRPKFITILGMCAGFPEKGMRLLDVIAAGETACWQEGKSLLIDNVETFDVRSNNLRASDDVLECLESALEINPDAYKDTFSSITKSASFVRLQNKFDTLVAAQPEVKTGLIVSGSEIVASQKRTQLVRQRHPSALGLEMEIYAVYTAAKRAFGAKPKFIAMKGVADIADSGKSNDAQLLASAGSAYAFLEFLNSFSVGKISGNLDLK